jgi:hypothetical protein
MSRLSLRSSRPVLQVGPHGTAPVSLEQVTTTHSRARRHTRVLIEQNAALQVFDVSSAHMSGSRILTLSPRAGSFCHRHSGGED